MFLSFTHLWFVNGTGLVSMGGRETEVRQQGQWNSHSQVTPWGRRTLGLERMLCIHANASTILLRVMESRHSRYGSGGWVIRRCTCLWADVGQTQGCVPKGTFRNLEAAARKVNNQQWRVANSLRNILLLSTWTLNVKRNCYSLNSSLVLSPSTGAGFDSQKHGMS